MQTFHLNGTWQLRYCDPGQGEALQWYLPASNWSEPQFAAHVPGDVHLDLLQAGMIDEPLVARNALDCKWMEEKDWWYRREFFIEPDFVQDRVELYFGGLDTTADIWLNGRYIGKHNNMFIPLTLDVTTDLHEGYNILVVRLDVGLRAASGKPLKPYNNWVSGDPTVPRWWIRKAQYTFSWDWAPRLLTCGIWRNVELRSYRTVALRDVHLRTKISSSQEALVYGTITIENLLDYNCSVQGTLQLTHHQTHQTKFQAILQPGIQTIEIAITISQPELWWPHSFGTPHLYDCRVCIDVDGQIVDTNAFRYGLREIALLREPLGEEEGESFTLVVNGQKIFCKGANWVPSDSIIARISPTRYRELVRLAVEANFNMLRVWGGGIFEDPYFYQLCDEAGILIWQDFLYACSYYPDDDPEFLAEARREAEAAVIALRNHPSIAIWCGNNENQWIHTLRKDRAADRCYGDIIYEQVLPEVCARLDPTRPYWPGSPWGGEDPNSELQGNHHAWHININNPILEEQADYHKYANDRAKFITEFGILSPPVLESFSQYLPDAEINRNSAGWQYHNNRFEKGTMQLALKKYWRPAEELSLQEYVQLAQLVQAEALKFSLEHWRRRKFKTSGTLFWMYADCWGEVGWTVIDYYLRKKPAYYVVKRVYSPVLSSIQQTEQTLHFWLTNDQLQDLEGTLEYGLLELPTGHMLTYQQEVQVAANTSQQCASLTITEQLEHPGRWLGYCRLITQGQVINSNQCYLAGFQYNALQLPPARYHWRIDEEKGIVIVQAETFVWQIQLVTPRGIDVDNNFFDLLPGEERQIVLQGPKELYTQIKVRTILESK